MFSSEIKKIIFIGVLGILSGFLSLKLKPVKYRWVEITNPTYWEVVIRDYVAQGGPGVEKQGFKKSSYSDKTVYTSDTGWRVVSFTDKSIPPKIFVRVRVDTPES